MANLLLFLTTFLFIFGWKITSSLDIIFLISCVTSFITLIILRPTFPKLIALIISLLLVISLYSGVIVILNGAADEQIFLRSVRSMINFIGGFSIAYLYVRRFGKKFSFQIINHIYLSIGLHAVIILLMYLNDTLRYLVYDMASTMSVVNDTTPIALGYRIPGLTYGLSTTSVVQMVGLLLLPYLLQHVNKSVWKPVYLLGALLIMVSIFLTGRTGLLFLILLFPLAMLFGNTKKEKKNIAKTAFNFMKIGAVGALLYFSFTFLMKFLPAYFREYTIEKAGEVTQFFTNSGNTETTVAIKSMYFLPTDALTFIFGSSNSGRGNMGYISSDVGFVLLIFSIGIIGLLIMLSVYLLSMNIALKTYVLDKKIAVVTLLVLLSSLMLNFKEVALFTRNQWSIQSLLICTCIYIVYMQREWRKN
ncbi:hypothetical protein [Planomicrobium sp. CPCC 101079]|uniref:hypothetical protein n=1 Tax=Planomicrobium sp. CPCC 101079 TaxID=2599618 RepID=UPI0011B73744|nr:hypothetical protein [Planomicrobium sp. CPCC 101079]TWT03630.1 hypothetical protein FQV28_11465 [Planomicrobium sp. CPCC 101079]